MPFIHSALIAMRQCWVSGGSRPSATARFSSLFDQLFVGLVIKRTGITDFATINDKSLNRPFPAMPSSSPSHCAPSSRCFLEFAQY